MRPIVYMLLLRYKTYLLRVIFFIEKLASSYMLYRYRVDLSNYVMI
jgi:hypothetical protein